MTGRSTLLGLLAHPLQRRGGGDRHRWAHRQPGLAVRRPGAGRGRHLQRRHFPDPVPSNLVVASGTVSTPAVDTEVYTGPVTVQGQGCYSWTDTLTLSGGSGTAVLPAGSPNEVVQATPYQTSLATTDVVTSGTGGTKSVVDQVTVSNSGLSVGNGAPTSQALTWNLYGPVPVDANNTCTNADWTGAPLLDSSASYAPLDVTADGTYTTPSTALTQVGCYSYTEDLPATTAGIEATQAIGASTETVLLLPRPPPPRRPTPPTRSTRAPPPPTT